MVLQRRRSTETARTGYRTGGLWPIYDAVAEFLDRRLGWYRLPTPLGLAVLVGVRNVLRRSNLFDTRTVPTAGGPAPGPREERYVTERTADGSYNDLDDP